MVQPLLLHGRPNAWIHEARYAESDGYDGSVLVTTFPYKLDPGTTAALHRCRIVDASPTTQLVGNGGRQLRCDEMTRLPGNGIYPIGLGPLGDAERKTLWAAAGFDVYTSDDAGRTFRRSVRPTSRWRVGGMIRDLAVVPGSGSRSVVVAQHGWGGDLSPLERTDDGGNTWTPLWVDVAGFKYEAVAVAATPTGRILAAGGDGGLACSADGGRTWAPLCDTPDTA